MRTIYRWSWLIISLVWVAPGIAASEFTNRVDVPLPQVLIEEVVFTVRLPAAEAADGETPKAQSVPQVELLLKHCGITNANVLWLANLVTDEPSSPPAGEQREFSYLTGLGNCQEAILAALAASERVKIIQKPRILTCEGKAAASFIGNTVPYGGSTKNESEADGCSPCGVPLRVGLQLEITPRAAADGFVGLRVVQDIEWVSGYTEILNVGKVPNTASAQLQADVIVRDRGTVLIGGMVLPPDPEHPAYRQELAVLMRATLLIDLKTQPIQTIAGL